ncbi:nucleotidyltransferase domain-containing protein [Streptomyces erythrochromogenes]|uniref:nucleotidyltransferase domain-containing protein n=1 Tax=Streptomyces erythrochromogenes TaxID=285574 RepID=UPI0037D48216
MTAEAAWDPAPVPEVADLFRRAGRPWWIAGGHAVELAVGHPVREHHDIDVLVLRDDQLAVQRALAGWEWWAADPPGTLRPWQPDEYLPLGVHDIWCRPGPGTPWRVQVMLDESRDGLWVSRRNAAVRRPVAELGAVGPGGVPYVTPEVQLYYKAKKPRPKDETDLAAALPVLAPAQRAWLASAVLGTYGAHPWVERLEVPEPYRHPPREGQAPVGSA